MILYGRTNCTLCHQAGDFLNLLGVPFKYVSLDKEDALAAFKAEYSSARTLPILVSESEVVEGFAAIKRFIKGAYKEAGSTHSGDTGEAQDPDKFIGMTSHQMIARVREGTQELGAEFRLQP